MIGTEAGQEIADEPARLIFGQHLARHLLAPVLAADRDRDRARRQIEGVEGQVGGKYILLEFLVAEGIAEHPITRLLARCAYAETIERDAAIVGIGQRRAADDRPLGHAERVAGGREHRILRERERSEEHTSELQSLMRISYAVLCLKQKKYTAPYPQHLTDTTT